MDLELCHRSADKPIPAIRNEIHEAHDISASVANNIHINDTTIPARSPLSAVAASEAAIPADLIRRLIAFQSSGLQQSRQQPSTATSSTPPIAHIIQSTPDKVSSGTADAESSDAGVAGVAVCPDERAPPSSSAGLVTETSNALGITADEALSKAIEAMIVKTGQLGWAYAARASRRVLQRVDISQAVLLHGLDYLFFIRQIPTADIPAALLAAAVEGGPQGTGTGLQQGGEAGSVSLSASGTLPRPQMSEP